MGSGNIDSTGSNAGPTYNVGPAVLMPAIEAQRRRLFRIAAVVAVCGSACASEQVELHSDFLADTLRIVFELIDDVAAALEGPAERILAAHAAQEGNRGHPPA